MNYEFHRSWNLIYIEILPFKFYWLSVLKCTNFPEFVFIVKIILTVKSLLINISQNISILTSEIYKEFVTAHFATYLSNIPKRIFLYNIALLFILRVKNFDFDRKENHSSFCLYIKFADLQIIW